MSLRKTALITRHILSSLAGNSTRRIHWDDRSFIEAMRLIRVCQGSELNSISIWFLARIPNYVVQRELEARFVDDLQLKWWRAFKPRLEQVDGYKLTHTILDLKRIDLRTGGGVIRGIGRRGVETLAIKCASDAATLHFNESHFSALVDSIETLLLFTGDKKLTHQLRSQLTKACESFFDPDLFPNRMFNDKCKFRLGGLVYRLGKCGVARPSDACSKTMVDCCASLFGMAEFDSLIFDGPAGHLSNLHQCAVVFLLDWDLKPERFCEAFWVCYLDEIVKHSSHLNVEPLNSLLKKDCITIGRKYPILRDHPVFTLLFS